MIKQCDSIIIPTNYVVCQVVNPTFMERKGKERRGNGCITGAKERRKALLVRSMYTNFITCT